MAGGSIPPGRTMKFQEDTYHRVCILFVISCLGCPLVAHFAVSFFQTLASRHPFPTQDDPAVSMVCHLECAPARSLAQGEAHTASEPHSLGNLRALPFSEGCAAAVSATLPLSPIHPETGQSSQGGLRFLGPSPTPDRMRVALPRGLAAMRGKYRWKNAQIEFPGVRT